MGQLRKDFSMYIIHDPARFEKREESGANPEERNQRSMPSKPCQTFFPV